MHLNNLKVTLSVIMGFMLCLFLFPIISSAYDSEALKEGFINDKGVQIRSGPGEDYDVIGELEKGEKITIVGEELDWFQIEHQYVENGFINQVYVNLEEDEEDNLDEQITEKKDNNDRLKKEANYTAKLIGEGDSVETLTDAPILQGGTYHPRVIQLKKDLAKIGFEVSKNPTDYYGPTTTQKVREFQAYAGLPVTGIADAQTLQKIDELKDVPILQGGTYHPRVIQLKKDLAKIGFEVSKNPTDYYGPTTTQKVREFQAYAGLPVTGIADAQTLQKIDELKDVPILQGGTYHPRVIQLKKDLAKIGFEVSKNPTDYYGPTTTQKVREFQAYAGLPVTGIADAQTLQKIDELKDAPILRGGTYHPRVIQLKKDLAQLGFEVSKNPTDYYGPSTTQKVREFQAYAGLPVTGIADIRTLQKIEELKKIPVLQGGTYHIRVIQLKQDLARLGFEVSKNPTDYYGPSTTQKVREFQGFVGLPVDGIAGNQTLIKIHNILSGRDNIKYTNYNITFNGLLDIQMRVNPQTDLYPGTGYVNRSFIKNGRVNLSNPNSSLNVRREPRVEANCGNCIGSLRHGQSVTIIRTVGDWYEIRFGSTWQGAKREDVAKYLNPVGHDIFQHLVLSRSVGVPATEINKVLNGKGSLAGKGNSFIEAGRQYKINEIYLISHALLETGNGTSSLARGVTVNGRTVYNMYGIGARDECPLECGSQYAYDQGWFTPEAAIVGGAKFISERYVNHPTYKQDTLYKMRWNPGNPGTHQYATDIGWAVKQISRIKNLYAALRNPQLYYDVPRYK